MQSLAPPTAFLPPLRLLAAQSTEDIQGALAALRDVYCPVVVVPKMKMGVPLRAAVPHAIHDASVPDSGYASGEEEDGCVDVCTCVDSCTCADEEREDGEDEAGEDEEERRELLRADTFERAYAVRWLTGLVARADVWCSSLDEAHDEEGVNDEEEGGEEDKRQAVIDEASALLSFFVYSGEEDERESAVTRVFAFPTSSLCTTSTSLTTSTSTFTSTSTSSKSKTEEEEECVRVELNDAPLDAHDHTSVGLQSWASSILLAQRMCLTPTAFSLPPPPRSPSSGILPSSASILPSSASISPSSASTSPSSSDYSSSAPPTPLRVLELGAGTGLLSIVAGKLLARAGVRHRIVATDYHAGVLANCRRNVEGNFPSSVSSFNSTPSTSVSSASAKIDVRMLDWQTPTYEGGRFDVVLAADVIYHADHARWIKACVEDLLVLPSSSSSSPSTGGTFWLVMPLRTIGRHEGMSATVDSVFPLASDLHARASTEGKPWTLAILHREEAPRLEGGVGRADEGGYILFKIGWV